MPHFRDDVALRSVFHKIEVAGLNQTLGLAVVQPQYQPAQRVFVPSPMKAILSALNDREGLSQ